MTNSWPADGEAAPTLSVILPNYNHALYLPRALDALLSQDRPADEIIIIDDGSTDDSREVIARYAASNPSIRFIPNEKNMGVIPTLALGLSSARGTYVYFGAADDYVLPGFFSTGLAALSSNSQAAMFCGEMALIDGRTGNPIGARPPVRPRFRAGYISGGEFACLLKDNDNFILTGAALIKRDAANWAGGFIEALSTFSDAYLVRKIALTYGFYYAPRACLTWCIFPDSVSRTTATELDRSKAIFREIEARMTKDTAFPDWYWPIFARRWRFSTCRLAVHEKPINITILIELGAEGERDRALLNWMTKFGGPLSRFLILSWLWYRFRPFTISSLLTTAVARAFAELPSR